MMNPEQVIARQAMKLEDLEVQLGESRELVLLLAGKVRGKAPTIIEISNTDQAKSVRVERTENGVRFYIDQEEGNG